MNTLQALQAAGWTLTEQRQDRWRIERGEWTIEVQGNAPVATLTVCSEWAPHGMVVACAVDAVTWPDGALSELMMRPLGSTTVGAFCGVA